MRKLGSGRRSGSDWRQNKGILSVSANSMYVRRAYPFGMKWLRLAGHSGDAEAQFVLGQVLAHHVSMGSTALKQGYTENIEEAAWWYWKSAVSGHPLGWSAHMDLIDELYE
jgi:TPR repeat protein